MATCPECDAELEIDEDDLEEMEVGDPWDCDACGSHLRVANLDPLEFDPDDEEDDADDELGDEDDSDDFGNGNSDDADEDDEDWDE